MSQLTTQGNIQESKILLLSLGTITQIKGLTIVPFPFLIVVQWGHYSTCPIFQTSTFVIVHFIDMSNNNGIVQNELAFVLETLTCKWT